MYIWISAGFITLPAVFIEMKKTIFAVGLLLSAIFSHAQVGINTTNPSPSAALDVASSSDNIRFGGFLPPRVTLQQREAMSPGADDNGLIIFLQDDTDRCLQIWDGEALEWSSIHCLPVANINLWINEIHYENIDGDVNEGVEIAGPAGMNLGDFNVVGYNGNNGTFYDLIVLSGTIDDESNGYGALWFDFINLQNGAPDGVALVKISTGQVVQFLSYEGGFNASNGDAAGQSSEDIGVNEANDTPIGKSLQLMGTGNEYSDFNWTGPVEHSRGSLNVGQTIN